jgi:hypothetical protein
MTIAITALNPTGTSTVAGGAVVNMSMKGQNLNTNKQLVEGAASFPLQQTVDFTYKAPSVLATAPSGYTQRRSSIIVRYPILTASGLYTTCTGTLSINSDVEMTDAAQMELRELIGQMAYNANLTNFYELGSLE